MFKTRRYVPLCLLGMLLALTACTQTAEKPTEQMQNGPKDALALLNRVWDSYGEDERFSAAGGDLTEENMREDAPGKFGIADTEQLNSSLGFPVDQVERIDGAASLTHMMNANTFTCGAFHVKRADDVKTVAAALKENILKRHWVCGFPDQLTVASVDDYIVSFFGDAELVKAFQNKLSAAFPETKILSEDPIE